MALTLKKTSDYEYVVDGLMFESDGVETHAKDWYNFFTRIIDMPFLDIKVKITYPDTITGINRPIRFFENFFEELPSENQEVFILNELYKAGCFDYLKPKSFHYGRKNMSHKKQILIHDTMDLIVDVPIYGYGWNCGIWLEVNFEDFINYPIELIKKIKPDWWVKKYITHGKKKINDYDRVVAMISLMNKKIDKTLGQEK